jgi:superfamily II DNA/RNA helicase
MVFKPTEEEHLAVELALKGGDMKIKAFAGTGKTSTL